MRDEDEGDPEVEVVEGVIVDEDDHGSDRPAMSPLVAMLAAQPGLFWLCIASIAVMIIGSFGSWAKAFGGFVSASGVDGGDGWIVISLAVVAAVCLYLAATGRRPRLLRLLACLAGIGGCAVFAIDARNVFGTQTAGEGNIFGNIDVVSPGWGLIVVGVSSLVLAIGAAIMVVRGG